MQPKLVAKWLSVLSLLMFGNVAVATDWCKDVYARMYAANKFSAQLEFRPELKAVEKLIDSFLREDKTPLFIAANKSLAPEKVFLSLEILSSLQFNVYDKHGIIGLKEMLDLDFFQNNFQR